MQSGETIQYIYIVKVSLICTKMIIDPTNISLFSYYMKTWSLYLNIVTVSLNSLGTITR